MEEKLGQMKIRGGLSSFFRVKNSIRIFMAVVQISLFIFYVCILFF